MKRRFKNNKEREEFIDGYRNWELHGDFPEYGIRFWRTVINDAEIFVEERQCEIPYAVSLGIDIDGIIETPTGDVAYGWYYVRHYLRTDKDKLFQNCKVSITELVDWLRKEKI